MVETWWAFAWRKGGLGVSGSRFDFSGGLIGLRRLWGSELGGWKKLLGCGREWIDR